MVSWESLSWLLLVVLPVLFVMIGDERCSRICGIQDQLAKACTLPVLGTCTQGYLAGRDETGVIPGLVTMVPLTLLGVSSRRLCVWWFVEFVLPPLLSGLAHRCLGNELCTSCL